MSGAMNGITAEVVNRVLEAIAKAGLVEVEVSARHVHLSEKDWEIQMCIRDRRRAACAASPASTSAAAL